MRVELHPDAAAEFVESVLYYSFETNELGRRFRDAVMHAIERVTQFPDIGRMRAGWRRLAIPGFPYDLVYRVKGETIEVLALAHHRRRPGYWKARTR